MAGPRYVTCRACGSKPFVACKSLRPSKSIKVKYIKAFHMERIIDGRKEG